MRRVRKQRNFALALVLGITLALALPVQAVDNSVVGSTGTHRQIIRPSGFGEAGTRALGMGEAFVALSDDASGGFWNPAGLAFMTDEKRHVDLMIKANEREEATYDSISIAGPVYTETKKADFSIQDYLESNLKAPVYGRRLNYHYGVGGIFIDQYGGAEIHNYFFSVGKKIDNIKGLSIGTKLRVSDYKNYLNDQNQAEDFMETALGTGAIYEVNKYLRIGMMVDNLLKDSLYNLPPVVTFGMAIFLGEGTTLALDGFNLVDDKHEVGDAEFRAGIEKKFLDDAFAIRMGTKNGNLNLGFEIQFTPEFHVGYAFMGDYDTDIQQHFVSGNVRF